MRKLILAGLVLGMGAVTAPAALADESGSSALATTMMGNRMGTTMAMPGRSARPGPGFGAMRGGLWGHRTNGRWSAGWNAPGGWVAYRRPAFGFVLPSYWVNPSYYIADSGAFGLPAPAYGYGWSRYYDDAVLTDQYGRVVDVRYGYDWDRYGGYDDGDYGSGDDYDAPEWRHAHRQPLPPEGLGYGQGDLPYADDAVTIGGRAAYEGRWVGTWYGRDGSTYSGVYDGRFDGDVVSQPSAAPALPYRPLSAYGYSGGGQYYEARTVAVDYVAPTVTTFVTEETTTYTKRVRKPAYKPRVWRARARPVCSCSCRCN